MKKFIKDTEILNIFSLYLHHKDVLIMTSYCKIFIGFSLKVTENLPFYQNKHGDIKARNDAVERNGRSSGYAYKIFGDNMSLVKIKKNVWTDRIFKWSVKCTFIHVTNAISKEISTHRRDKCARGAENIYDDMTSNVPGMLHNGLHLIMGIITESRDMKMRQRTKYNM